MGQGSSNPLREQFENLHSELMRHAGADYDIATAGTLSYEQFLTYIRRLNDICREYKDEEGNVLVFAVKKDSDQSVFWKVTVRVACVKLKSSNNKVLSHRLLNIRQFLQIFRRITYECTEGALGEPASSSSDGSNSREGQSRVIPPTIAATLVLAEELNQSQSSSKQQPSSNPSGAASNKIEDDQNLEECVICLERKPEAILPCAHAYCLPCIEQWWEYSNPTQDECSDNIYALDMNVVDKTCPVCRESLNSTDDTWVISDMPDDGQVNAEIRAALMGLAKSQNNSNNPYT